MPTDEIEITELAEFEPTRIDGVGKAATGFPILMLKSIDGEVTETETTIDEVLADLDKAEADANTDTREPCDACADVAKSESDAPCKKCFGTRMLPKLGESPAELIAAAKASAASGAPVPIRDDCPTCHGSGTISDGTTDGKECVDCDGSGHDGTEPPADKLARVDADGHRIHVGDAKNREAVDKSINLYDDANDTDLEKAKLKTKARDALPDSAFALPQTREYPIHDENHARAALSMLHNASPADQKKIKAAVHAKFPDIGESDDAQKADGSIMQGANPQLAAAAASANDDGSGSDDDTDASTPGSPAWEAIDAQTALDAATALACAAELIRTFANREDIEVAAGEGSDVFDSYAATSALSGVTNAIGIMATLAFHEGLEAAKSADDTETVEKSGKRLSTKSVSALAAARDHITQLLGDDDPANNDDNDDAATKSVEIDMDKLSKEIEDMEMDELTKWADARDEKLVGVMGTVIADAMKGLPAKNTAAAIASAKTANNKSKKKNPKADAEALEDETEQGTNDSASSPAEGAAKAEGDEVETDVETEEVTTEDEAAKADAEVDVELTPEEIEANEVAQKAKKDFKAAKKAKKEAAENAALTKSIENALTEVVKQNAAIQEQNAALNATVEKLTGDLEGVKKMAAPSTITRTAPIAAQNVAKERDVLELELTRYERLAKEADNIEYRRECSDRAKALRVRIASADKV